MAHVTILPQTTYDVSGPRPGTPPSLVQTSRVKTPEGDDKLLVRVDLAAFKPDKPFSIKKNSDNTLTISGTCSDSVSPEQGVSRKKSFKVKKTKNNEEKYHDRISVPKGTSIKEFTKSMTEQGAIVIEITLADEKQ